MTGPDAPEPESGRTDRPAPAARGTDAKRISRLLNALRPGDVDADPPPLALRRATDRCFFAVDELRLGPGGEVTGFVIDGFAVPLDEVAELRRSPEGDVCAPPQRRG